LFDDYCRRTGGNNALLIMCDQTRREPKHGIISLLRKAALWQNCGEDDAKTGRCWVVWILFSSVTQIVHK
jgi:hypothetical protein